MTGQTLNEASKELLQGNVGNKRAQAEPFGANSESKRGSAKFSNQPQKGGEEIGGPLTDTTDNGIAQSVAKAPRATAPGKSAPVGQEKQDDIRSGYSRAGGKRAKARNDGVVVEEPLDEEDLDEEDLDEEILDEEDLDEEEVEEGFETDTTHNIEDLEGEDGGTPPKFKRGNREVRSKVTNYIKAKKGDAGMSEDISAIFSGDDLTEDFKGRASVVFEAAVIAAATDAVEAVEDELVEEFNDSYESLKEELAGQVDDYLNYMVEEWMADNEIAIERGIRAELAEDFIAGLHSLFLEHYIDVPEDKVDVVEELANKVEDLEEDLNEQYKKGIELAKELNEWRRYDIVRESCEGLTDVQKDKLLNLVESVEFTTPEAYAETIETIKESYYPTKTGKVSSETRDLNESALGDTDDGESFVEDETSDEMAAYVNFTGKSRRFNN